MLSSIIRNKTFTTSSTTTILNTSFVVLNRFYTVIVERQVKIPALKKDLDPRKYTLKSRHYQYKFVDCLHNKKWGNVELILTDYIEGIGHKGEIVSVPRHTAYYDLLPARLAVYPTEEYLKLYEKDREAAAKKAKVSPYALKAQDELQKMVLNIPMNPQVDWVLTKNNVRLALRYNKVVCDSVERIIFPEGLEITSKNYKNFTEPFQIEIKINDYLNAFVKCKIQPVDPNKLWEEFAPFNKTV